MRPLHERQRRSVVTWSVLCCAVPLCLAPLAGRTSFELASEKAAFDARFPAPVLQNVWSEKPVEVARDPFVPDIPADVSAAVPSGVVGVHVTQGDAVGISVPQSSAASQTSGAPAAGPLLVRAVVTGTSPRALIDDGTRVRMVAVGDEVGGSRVASIGRRGVRLQNGVFVALSEDRL